MIRFVSRAGCCSRFSPARGPSPFMTAADAAAGLAVFRTQCGVCHSPLIEGKNMVGPSLFGVVGRKSGSIDGFHYSAAQ